MNRDDAVAPADYLDYSCLDDVLSGGVRLIPIETSKGSFAFGRNGSAITPG